MASLKRNSMGKKLAGLALGLVGCILMVEAIPVFIWYCILGVLTILLISFLVIY